MKGTHCTSFLQVDVEHEPAYRHDEGADNLWAIVKIAQAVQQTSLRYDQ